MILNIFYYKIRKLLKKRDLPLVKLRKILYCLIKSSYLSKPI